MLLLVMNPEIRKKLDRRPYPVTSYQVNNQNAEQRTAGGRNVEAQQFAHAEVQETHKYLSQQGITEVDSGQQG